MKTILVTGGAGYIGSHTCVELLAAGYGVVVVDSLESGCEEALHRVEQLSHRDLMFVQADVRDKDALDKVFKDFPVDAVIHLAGLKSVADSVANPDLYYDVNFGGSIALCDVMEAHGIKEIVFASSATVYGLSESEPIPEYADTKPVTPVGKTKLAVERHLRELHESDSAWNCICLRSFNAAGAHPSGLLGEVPSGATNNLFLQIAQVAMDREDCVEIYGFDHSTDDGTCMRDYTHVVELAQANVQAVNLLKEQRGYLALNLGSGRLQSVMEVLKAFEKAAGKTIPFEIKPRREGDLAMYCADTALADMELGWQARADLEEIARDAWNFQLKHPQGYR